MKIKYHVAPIFILSTYLFIAIASSTPNYALKGQYRNSPYKELTSTEFDVVWSRAIDILAETGASIKIIDKSSGIIISEKYSFINSYSYENPGGSLINPNALVVLSELKDAFGKTINPNEIFGEFNIRIKSTDSGTLINVNIVNLNAKHTYYSSNGSKIERHWQENGMLTIKSTGLFERRLIGKLK